MGLHRYVFAALHLLGMAPTLAAATATWRAGRGSVLFDPQRLTISAISADAAVGPGSNAAAGSTGAVHLFSAKVWNAGEAPGSWALPASPVSPAGWTLQPPSSAASSPAAADSRSFRWLHKDAQLSAVLTASPSLFAAEPLLLHLNVTNTGAAPTRLAEVTFPEVGGVRASDDDDDGGELVTGGGVRGTGLRVRRPGFNLDAPQLRWYEHGYKVSYIYQDAYPHASTNWLALADASSALYFGIHDTSLTLTSMQLSNRSRACSPVPGAFCLSLTANSSVPLAPGASWSRTVAIALTREESTSHIQVGQGGDDDTVTARPSPSPFTHWSLAARIYRSWFNTAFAPPSLPSWATRGFAISGIDASGDREFYGERETEVDDPWWFGSSHLIVWGTSAVPQCCPGFPPPDPGRGGTAALGLYAQRLHAAGMTMATYFESQRSNPVFSSARSFRGQSVAALPPKLRPPQLSQLMKYSKHNDPSLPTTPMQGNYQTLVAEYNRQNGSHSDVVRYFNLERNHTELHVLYPMYNDVDLFWNNYLASWMEELGSTGVSAPYCDQMGFDPEVPDFGPSAWGDGSAGFRMQALMAQGGAAAAAYSKSSVNGSWGFTYEGYTDFLSQAGGAAMLSGHRFIPCISICSPSVPHRCDLCDTEWPWLDSTTSDYGNPLHAWNVSRGLETFWPVTRATFPHHAVFEGLNNIPMSAPIALRAVGLGFTDGHVADLYAAGSGSVFGLLSPVTWMRQAVSPFLDRHDVEYRHTEGVLSASSPDAAPDGGRVDTKQFRRERGAAGPGVDWVMWLFFSPAGTAEMALSAAAEASALCGSAGGSAVVCPRWYLMEGGGSARALTGCEGQVMCNLTAFAELDPVATAPAFAGTVLVVGSQPTPLNNSGARAASRAFANNVGAGAAEDGAAGRATATASNTVGEGPGDDDDDDDADDDARVISLARVELIEPFTPELSVTSCNVGAEPLAASISLDYLETDAQLLAVSSVEAAAALPRTLALQVPAFSCATSSVRFNMSAFELPLHVRLNGAGLVPDLRRLIPVPIIDPQFRHRRYSSGVMARPDPVETAITAEPSASSVLSSTGAQGDKPHFSGVFAAPPPIAPAGPFVMSVSDSDTDLPYRNLYWPPSVPGKLHVRFVALLGPPPPGSGSPPTATVTPLSFGIESWRIDSTWKYTHGFPRCTGQAPVGVWATASLPIWGGGGVSAVSWAVLRVSVNGFASLGLAGVAPARVLLDRIEALPSASEPPSWATGLPVMKC